MTHKFDPTLAVRAVKSVPKTRAKSYAEYWRYLHRHLTPEGVHLRWAYAFASVNAGVACHLRCTRYFAKYRPGFSAAVTEPQFVARVRRARVGGQFAIRAGGVHRFDKLYAAAPAAWNPPTPTPETRDQLADKLYGLGRAKTAFALELIDPIRCTAVCLDRHGLRLYGATGVAASKASDTLYEEAEAHWVAACRKRNLPPAIVRHCVWDMRVNRADCRWWSSLFEPWFDVPRRAVGFHETRWV